MKDYEKIKNDKIREAEKIYSKFNIPINRNTIEIQPVSDQDSLNNKFHWTRLSYDSNLGCIVK